MSENNNTLSIHEYLDDIHMEVPWTDEEAKDGDDLKILMKAFRELKRNIHEYSDLTVPYKRRIDLSEYKVKDLIEKLNKLNPELECYTIDCNGEWQTIGDAWIEQINQKDIAYLETFFAHDGMNKGGDNV